MDHPCLHQNSLRKQFSDRKICPNCDDWFFNEEIFKDHIENSHEENIKYCSCCKIEYSIKLKHEESHLKKNNFSKSESEYRCSKCHFSFVDKNYLEKHLATHTNSDFTCSFCNLKFDKEESLTEHIKCSYFLEICNICNMEFTSTLDLFKHNVKTHLMTCCEICGKVLKRGSYKNHKLLHQNLKKFKCEECGACYKTPNHLGSHIINVHKSTSEVCEICGLEVKKVYLKQHQLIHNNSSNYKCDKCHKAFKQSKGLTKHRVVHEGIAKHVCDVCNKAFKRSYNLTVHKRSHESIKPFTCDVCTKTFTTKQWRDKHMTTHPA